MGLDIYLYRYGIPQREDERLASEYEKASDKICKKIQEGREFYELTEVEKTKAHSQTMVVAKKLGLTGKYESHPDVKKVEKDSKKYPSHMFKIGYFRSSYNDGGINQVLQRIGLPTLGTIFGETKEDKYCFRPN